VLIREAGGTLETIAKDVKIQVEFNPREVAASMLPTSIRSNTSMRHGRAVPPSRELLTVNASRSGTVIRVDFSVAC
jgi:hypothetical protein